MTDLIRGPRMLVRHTYWEPLGSGVSVLKWVVEKVTTVRRPDGTAYDDWEAVSSGLEPDQNGRVQYRTGGGKRASVS